LAHDREDQIRGRKAFRRLPASDRKKYSAQMEVGEKGQSIQKGGIVGSHGEENRKKCSSE